MNKSASAFNIWFNENEDFLSPAVSIGIARIIWDSSQASAMHDIVGMLTEGTLKINLTDTTSKLKEDL